MLARVQSFFNRLSKERSIFYLSGAILLLGLQTECAFAAGNHSVEHFVANLSKTFILFKGLMIRVAFMCGIGFMMMGIFKLKAHRDNPAQVPLSTSLVLMLVGVCLLFFPTVFELAGSAVFGEAAQPGLPLTETIHF